SRSHPKNRARGWSECGTFSPAPTSAMATPTDRRVVEVQIGRPVRADVEVVSRCHLGVPVVVKVPPLLDDGTPFPTLYWLSCPLAAKRIGRLESAGGVRRLDQKAAVDSEFAAAIEEAHRAYG